MHGGYPCTASSQSAFSEGEGHFPPSRIFYLKKTIPRMHGVVATHALQVLKVLRVNGEEFPLKIWCLSGGTDKLVRISNGSRVLSEMHGYDTKCCGSTGNGRSCFGTDL